MLDRCARAVPIAVGHTAAGLAMGTLLNQLELTNCTDVSVVTQAYGTVLAVALNAVAVAVFSSLIPDDDPTFGIPFSVALLAAQPGLSECLSQAASAFGKGLQAARSPQKESREPEAE